MSEKRVEFRLADGRQVVTQAEEGCTLLDCAKLAGVPIDAPCAGKATCGKCKVRLVTGDLNSERTRHISEEAYAQGWRLACNALISDDLVIEVPKEAFAYQSQIRVTDLDNSQERQVLAAFRTGMEEAGFAPQSSYQAMQIELAAPSLDDAQADGERLLAALAKHEGLAREHVSIAFEALRMLPLALRDGNFAPWLVVRRDTAEKQELTHSLTVVAVSAEPLVALGLAVDIGTTTVSALITNLATGEVLASGTAGNAQIRYGADVINRLIESTRPGGLERLREAIASECLQALVASLAQSVGYPTDAIYRASIAGNTTMIHLLAGVYCNNLRLEPYVPAFFLLDGLRGADLQIGINPNASVCLAPAVGSYVGGDITAGVLSLMQHRLDEWTMLVDLGTNGEIVFGNSELLMSCACSAGPAFEGGDISCGMRATDGAIEAVDIDEESMQPVLKVIGQAGQKPVGICGSGLIDLITELHRCGIIDARGRFQREGSRVLTDVWGSKSYLLVEAKESETGNAITLTDADIDNFVRAKGSVFSAIRTLLNETGMTVSDIDRLYIAGGIGSSINITNAIAVGMLPALPQERYHYVGNTSLRGAYAMLSSEEAYQEVKLIANNITYLELSAMTSYMDEFIAACFIPHTDASLFEQGGSSA